MATVSAQLAMLGLQMIGTIVVARLLTPDDYGLFAMVAVVVGFARMFRDAGLTAATIQQEFITRAQMSTLFWINMGFISLLGLCLVVGAPLIARFYGYSELTGLTVVMAGAFVVSGFSIQHDALIKRHMRFGVMATGQIVAQALSVAAMITLAFAGLRYWALVGGVCVAALATTLFSLYLCPWIPNRMRLGTGVRGMLRFGSNVMGFNLVNYFSRNADNVLVGRYIGADGLGLYSRAYSLFLMPLQQVRGPLVDVAMPALSALRDQPERFRAYYGRLLDTVSMLGVPLAMYSLVEADFLIRVLLGPEWTGVVPVFRILAVVGLVQVADGTRGVVLLSQGLSRRHMTWGVINAVVVVCAFVAGLPFGIVGVAGAYAVVSYALLLPSLYYCFAGTPVTVGHFLKALAPFLAFACIAGGIAYAVDFLMESRVFWGGIVSSAVFVVCYALLSATRRTARENVRRVMAELRPQARRGASHGRANDHVSP